MALNPNNPTTRGTAENDDVRTYIINVTRQKQADNYLTSIVVTGNDGVNYSLSPDFDKETLTYNITVPYDVTALSLNAIKEDEAASIEIEGNIRIGIGIKKEVDVLSHIHFFFY
mgnify:CR=1 FL=1